MDYSKEIDAVSDAVLEAASFYMNKSREYTLKGNKLGVYDVVTPNDIEAESIIKKAICKAFPDDEMICEESKNSELTDKRTWIVDPIDGTINYTRNIPIFGTQVALLVNREPVVSVMYLPNEDAMFTAVKGQGAKLNGRSIHVSSISKLSECLLSLGDHSRGSVAFRRNQANLLDAAYDHVARIKMMGSSCCDFTFFAAGRYDIHARFIRDLWDFMPGLLMSTEAGGVYDEELLKERKLFVIANSKENLSAFREEVVDRMVWCNQ